MLSSISKPPDQISKLEALARVQAAIVTLIGDMIDAPAMQTNAVYVYLLTYVFYFTDPVKALISPFQASKVTSLLKSKEIFHDDVS